MTYPGGKNRSGVYQQIINLMPPHQVYIEPFLGSGAVMRLKRPAALNIGSDVKLLPSTTAAILEAHHHRTSPPDPAGGSTAIAYRQSQRSGPRRPADPPPPPGTVIGAGELYSADTANCGAASDRQPVFRFEERKAEDTLQHFRAGREARGALVYCDPPYLFATRRGLTRDRYENEMTDRDHIQLLTLLKKLPCHVIISGYASDLYTRMLEGWNRKSFQTTTRGGRPATEWLWYNFSEPTELHDYRYLGENYRERERIKKKKARWVLKLRTMPKLEKQALLAAIQQAT